MKIYCIGYRLLEREETRDFLQTRNQLYSLSSKAHLLIPRLADICWQRHQELENGLFQHDSLYRRDMPSALRNDLNLPHRLTAYSGEREHLKRGFVLEGKHL